MKNWCNINKSIYIQKIFLWGRGGGESKSYILVNEMSKLPCPLNLKTISLARSVNQFLKWVLMVEENQINGDCSGYFVKKKTFVSFPGYDSCVTIILINKYYFIKYKVFQV